jgi:hypothetical protein
MALKENVDYILLGNASRLGSSIMDQHKGSMLATKNFLILVVSHNMDLMKTAFGDNSRDEEYRDHHSLNPFKDIVNAAHNVKVSTQELKDSMKDNKEFRQQERKVKDVHKTLETMVATADSVETLHAQVKELCLENEQSLMLHVDQIHEMKSGFFKVGFAGCRILMRDGMQIKIICRKVGRIQKFIGK